MRRGEIYLIYLCGQGSEQNGARPALIVQNDQGNDYAPTTIVCPLTTRHKPKLPTHVSLTPQDSGILQRSTVLCEQVRVVDKSRVGRKLGEVRSQHKLEAINQSLMVSLGVLNLM